MELIPRGYLLEQDLRVTRKIGYDIFRVVDHRPAVHPC